MLVKYFLFLIGILFLLIGFLLYLVSKQHDKSISISSIQRKQSFFFIISALVFFLVNTFYVAHNIQGLTAISFFVSIFISLLIFIILTLKWSKIHTSYISITKGTGLLKWTFIVLIIIAPIYFAKKASKVPAIYIDSSNENIVIAGRYGCIISLDKIATIDTVTIIPKVGSMHSGSGFFISYIGTFELEGEGKGKLFIYRENPPYLKIRLNDSSFLYVNFKNSTETYNFYNDLMSRR